MPIAYLIKVSGIHVIQDFPPLRANAHLLKSLGHTAFRTACAWASSLSRKALPSWGMGPSKKEHVAPAPARSMVQRYLHLSSSLRNWATTLKMYQITFKRSRFQWIIQAILLQRLSFSFLAIIFSSFFQLSNVL